MGNVPAMGKLLAYSVVDALLFPMGCWQIMVHDDDLQTKQKRKKSFAVDGYTVFVNGTSARNAASSSPCFRNGDHEK